MAISLTVVKENIRLKLIAKKLHMAMSISKAIIGDSIIGLYTLSQDIYVAQVLQQFDIYKYLRI